MQRAHGAGKSIILQLTYNLHIWDQILHSRVYEKVYVTSTYYYFCNILFLVSRHLPISTFTHHNFSTRLLPIRLLPIGTFTHHRVQLKNRLLPVTSRHLPISLFSSPNEEVHKGKLNPMCTVGSACSTMHCQWGLMKNTALVTKLNIHFSRPYSMSVDPKK